MMLADFRIIAQTGKLEPEVQLPGTARLALLDFVEHELPRWRDHPERRPKTSERDLTDQLCDYLNSAARSSVGWDWFQFRTEVPDEVQRSRTIDLSLKPCGVVLVIEGRRHTQFDTLLPIECKRLPTPREKDRDEREYVTTAPGSGGGIQRFKFGHHGANHHHAAMIAYVQQETCSHWLTQVNGWIRELSSETDSPWSLGDALEALKDDPVIGICTLHSRHQRVGGLDEITLQHLWIKMN
jgi:hypothetical protein